MEAVDELKGECDRKRTQEAEKGLGREAGDRVQKMHGNASNLEYFTFFSINLAKRGADSAIFNKSSWWIGG